MALADDVANGMTVLELLSGTPEGMGPSRVAAELGVNKAIAHRLLQALVSAGYVAQETRTATYFATHKVGALGLRQLSSSGVDTWAQRTLDRLAATSEELVRLAVAGQDGLEWIAKAQGSNSLLRLDPVMGQEVVPYATASGKAWLASLGDQRIEEILAARALVARTAHTVVDPSSLLEELAAVRHRGYATTFEEMDLGINAVAAPIFGHGREHAATGTISIAGPSVRMTRARLTELTPALVDAATEIAASWPSYAYLTSGGELTA